MCWPRHRSTSPGSAWQCQGESPRPLGLRPLTCHLGKTEKINRRAGELPNWRAPATVSATLAAVKTVTVRSCSIFNKSLYRSGIVSRRTGGRPRCSPSLSRSLHRQLRASPCCGVPSEHHGNVKASTSRSSLIALHCSFAAVVFRGARGSTVGGWRWPGAGRSGALHLFEGKRLHRAYLRKEEGGPHEVVSEVCSSARVVLRQTRRTGKHLVALGHPARHVKHCCR